MDITYPQLVETWETLLVDVYCGRAPYWERFDALLRDVGLAENRLPTVRDAAQRKGAEVQDEREPMQDVPDTLRDLKKGGIRLAALSDTESGEQAVRKILRQLGIVEYFDAVVTSADIGIVKPNPKAYLAAASALNLDTSRCAFVAHDVDELEGSRQAGLYSIAFNYHPDAPADVYIEKFGQLIDIVFEAAHEGR